MPGQQQLQKPKFEEPNKIVPHFARASAVLTGMMILAGCGGGPTKPPEEEIPARLFHATFTSVSNTCGVPTGVQFELNFLPVENGASLYGLDDTPVSANFSGNVLTFSLDVPIDSIAITFGADWTFAQDRETFDGATTLDVSLNGSPYCSHALSTAGAVVGEIASQPPPTPQDPANVAATLAGVVGASYAWGVYEKVMETGLVRARAPAVVNCTVVDNTRRIYVPGTEVTDLEGSAGGFTPTPRHVTATVFLMRWDPSTAQWLTLGEFSEGLQTDVYAPYWNYMAFTISEYQWSALSDMYWNLEGPGYYAVTTRYLWHQRNAPGALIGDPYELGRLWFTPGVSDYVVGDVVLDTPWCHYP